MRSKINRGIELMLRRAKKPQEPPAVERKGFAFNPSFKLFRKRYYLTLRLEWEESTKEQ